MRPSQANIQPLRLFWRLLWFQIWPLIWLLIWLLLLQMSQAAAWAVKTAPQIGIVGHHPGATVIIKNQAAREHVHIAGIMRNNHRRYGEIRHQFQQFFAQALTQQRIKRRERLVQQQKLRFGIERAGQSRALPLAAGKL